MKQLRHFKSILFQGNCRPGGTESEILRLQKLFQEALSLSGGLQQAPMSTDPIPTSAEEHEIVCLHEELDGLVKDIAMALTGKEYVVKEK